MTQPIPPSEPERRRRAPQETRTRLVRAALDLFTTQGYHESTTPQIAKRAGVAEGTIYRHFESKEHMLNEIYRGAVRLFTEIVTNAPGAVSCRERLSTIATQWREVAERDAGLVKLVFVLAQPALLEGRSRSAYGELRQGIEKVLASGKAAGEVRPGPVELWADVWLQLVRLMLQRVASREWNASQPAPQQVVDAAWDAIAAVSRPPQPQ